MNQIIGLICGLFLVTLKDSTLTHLCFLHFEKKKDL